uniref:Putative radical SAM superfamily protein n=1 Tax=viral metagenome TaxID=1070528 RepID=A0A6M3LFC7_9ZZZZ
MEIGVEKLLHFPEKTQSILRGYDDLYPCSMTLTLTNQCNAKCSWCSAKSIRGLLPDKLTRKNLAPLWGDLKTRGTTGITLEGHGEPTLHPEFKGIVQDIVEAGLEVGLITNGILYDYEDVSPLFNWIEVSLDAGCVTTYRDTKKVDAFERVRERVVDMLIDRPGQVTGIGYVVTRRNKDEVSKMITWAQGIGASYFNMRPVVDAPAQWVGTGGLPETDNYLGMPIINHMREHSIDGNAGLPCIAHSLSGVIAADGSVLFCARLANKYAGTGDFPVIGNILEQPFHAIWNSQKRWHWARRVADRQYTLEHCPACRFTKFNQVLWRRRNCKTRGFI